MECSDAQVDQGKARGEKELDRLIKEFLQKKDCPVRKITMLEEKRCVYFRRKKELPDYTKHLQKERKIYQFIGYIQGDSRMKTEGYYVNTGVAIG